MMLNRDPFRRESLPRTVLSMVAAAVLSGAWPHSSGAAAAAGELRTATESINALGLDLLRRSSATDGNTVLSPYSIQTALAMTWAGAADATYEEMTRVLHYPSDEQALHRSMAALREALESAADRTVRLAERARANDGVGDPLTLSVANRLFGHGGFAFREPFLALTRDVYAAPFEVLDFESDPERARQHINHWVEEQTRRRIADLIAPGGIEEDTRLVLVNAIHLQAPWREPFAPSATGPAPFHLRDGRTVEIPTMRHKGRFGFAQRDGFRVVTLPYLGGELQFLILLPDRIDGLDRIEFELTADQLVSFATVPPAELILHLPKFRVEPPLMRLGAELQALGMKTAFDKPRGTANFDRMAPRRPDDYLKISEVFHKTFLALDEQGTEAAAATAVAMLRVTALPVPTPDPIEVRVDRPFLFAVQHRPSGAALFLGRIGDPR
jgi:serpin B